MVLVWILSLACFIILCLLLFVLSCPKGGESSLVGKISASCFSLKIFSFRRYFKEKKEKEIQRSPAIILGQSMLQFTQN